METNKKISKWNIARGGVLSGVLVGVGDIVMMEVENPYLAAFLFCIALVCVIELRFYLVTGMFGKVIKIYNLWDILLALAMNAVGCTFALLTYCCMDINNIQTIRDVADAKFANTNFAVMYYAGCMCGILIHIACVARKDLITVLAIMVFILCGFRHSVADVGYLIFSSNPSYILPWFGVLCGNAVGAICTEGFMGVDS